MKGMAGGESLKVETAEGRADVGTKGDSLEVGAAEGTVAMGTTEESPEVDATEETAEVGTTKVELPAIRAAKEASEMGTGGESTNAGPVEEAVVVSLTKELLEVEPLVRGPGAPAGAASTPVATDTAAIRTVTFIVISGLGEEVEWNGINEMRVTSVQSVIRGWIRVTKTGKEEASYTLKMLW